MHSRTNRRARRVAVGAASGAAVAAVAATMLGAGSTTVAASDEGSLSVGPVALTLQNADGVSPGDWLSFGWALAIPAAHHPAASLRLSGVVVELPVSCPGGTTSKLRWTFTDQTATIPAGDAGWFPTAQSGAAAGFQLRAQAPDACAGHRMSVSDHNSSGARLAATLTSSDSADTVEARFHGIDAYSGGDDARNIDCGSASNPGDGTCNAPWSASASVRSAPPEGEPRSPTPGPPGSSGPLSTLPVVIGRGSHVAGITASAGPTTPSPTAAPATGTPAPTSTPPGSLVLGPVPILSPVAGNTSPPAGTVIPWYWFVVLAALDLALIIVVALRRGLPRSPS